jgi:cytochrome c
MKLDKNDCSSRCAATMTRHLLIPSSLLAVCIILYSAAAVAADPNAGKKLFGVQCSACHSPVAGVNMVGPSLFGVLGRQSGSIADFRYSAANRDAGLTWDEETLDKYLTNPRAMLPGTTMPFAGIRSGAQRADVIAYLATLK